MSQIQKEECMQAMPKVLGFDPEGLKSLHFFINGLDYPVVAAEYAENDSYAFRCLDASVKAGVMDSESVCEWCMNHRIYFRLLYGVRLRTVLRSPRKTWRFLQMRTRLKQYSSR